MHIHLGALTSLIIHIVSIYLIITLINKFDLLKKDVEKIKKNSLKEGHVSKKNNNDITNGSKFTEKESKKDTNEQMTLANKVVKKYSYSDTDIDKMSEEEEEEEMTDDANVLSEKGDSIIENFETEPIIEGFNSTDYNDILENKLGISNSNVYDTDFSNIYNNYVKDNLLDIQKAKYNNNNTSLYIKSKCRGWKKK